MTLEQRKKRHRLVLNLVKTVCLFELGRCYKSRWPCNDFANRVCLYPSAPTGPLRSQHHTSWPELLVEHFNKHPEDNIYGVRVNVTHFRRTWLRLGYKNLLIVYKTAMKELKKETRITTIQVSHTHTKWGRITSKYCTRMGYKEITTRQWHYLLCPTVLTALAAV